jgi:plasmid stabilization system protein ParE
VKYTFATAASAELREAVDFYDRRQPGLGEEFFEEVEQAISRILPRPTSWKKLSENTYRCRVERFPYFLIYEKKPDRIRIVAVAHFRRRPNYWRSRVTS